MGSIPGGLLFPIKKRDIIRRIHTCFNTYMCISPCLEATIALFLSTSHCCSKASGRHFERCRSFRHHVRRKRARRGDGAIERSGWSRRTRAITPLYSSWLPGLTLATCAEVEGEADLNCNNADSYFTAERECSLQEDFGELIVKDKCNDSSR